jgi:hypothetical protein
VSESTRTIDLLLKELADPALRGRLADAVNALRKPSWRKNVQAVTTNDLLKALFAQIG